MTAVSGAFAVIWPKFRTMYNTSEGSGGGTSDTSNGGANTAVMGIGAGVNAIMSALGNRRFMRKQARDNRAWDYRMWNETNVYNSPIEQRKRLIAGGYNPQLALGGLNNNASMVHTAPGQPGEMPDFSGVLQTMYQMPFQKKQMDVMDAQIAATKQQAALNGVKTTHEAVKEAKSYTDLTQASALYNTAIDNAQAVLGKAKADESRALAEAEIAKLNLSFLPQKQQQEIRESVARIQNMQASASHSEVQAQIASERKRWMAMGMTSDQIARATGELLKLLKPF